MPAHTYRELASLVVDADVGNVHGIGGRGNGGPARGAHEVAHESGKSTLFLAAVGLALLCNLAIVAVAIAARALGARWRGIHLAACNGSEGGRLAQLGGAELGGLVCGEGVLGAGGAGRFDVAGGGVPGVDDGGGEGRPSVGGRKVGKRGRGRRWRVRGTLLADGREERGRAMKAGRGAGSRGGRMQCW